MPTINTYNKYGSVALNKYSDGSGIDSYDFFDPTFFNGLIQMQNQIFNSKKLSEKTQLILDEYHLRLDDHLNRAFSNDDCIAVFTLQNSEYYAYVSFVNDELFVIEVCDASTDATLYEAE